MNLTIRWLGEKDPVKIEYIRQIPGINGVVTSVHPPAEGGVISNDAIMKIKNTIESHGLNFEVVESLDVNEDIKLGLPSRDKYIENYKQNIRNYAKVGIKVIVYNFRPMFRWARTELNKVLSDGSKVSIYDQQFDQIFNPFINDINTSNWHKENSRFIYENTLTSNIKLDGYYTENSRDILNRLLEQYKQLTKEGLWENLKYFLKEVIPVADDNNVKLAIHPDDPPWDLFGMVPRIITDEADIDRLLGIVDSPSNCITLCTGTFGSLPQNDVLKFAKKYCAVKRVPFVHLRNVKVIGERSVEECAHYSQYGSLDMVTITKALYDNGFDGYIRPDHGRGIWGEEVKTGNGLYDRALGAQYILGIWETLSKI